MGYSKIQNLKRKLNKLKSMNIGLFKSAEALQIHAEELHKLYDELKAEGAYGEKARSIQASAQA